MGRELAFALLNPYTIAKSRTGGVIARFIARTNLRLVGARMYGPSLQLVGKYSEMVRTEDSGNSAINKLIADYILTSYAPNPITGKSRRVMLLLFEGEDAVRKVWEVTGSATLRNGSGETIRDTYGDYVLDAQKNVRYFEPAVIISPAKKGVASALRLWSDYSDTDGGIISSADDVAGGSAIQKTLVLIKPDNFRCPSARPGNIIDVLSMSGLRIVGIKKFSMTVRQAEDFYGPVRSSLSVKFAELGCGKFSKVIQQEFGFKVPDDTAVELCSKMGPFFADSEFEKIVQFMTGYRPSECSQSEKGFLGSEECLALVYEGENAVSKIRDILGTTDPSKARPGSVRREYGSSIMINAAHASDSPENAEREIGIVNVSEDTIGPFIARYYGGPIDKIHAFISGIPTMKAKVMRDIRRKVFPCVQS